MPRGSLIRKVVGRRDPSDRDYDVLQMMEARKFQAAVMEKGKPGPPSTTSAQPAKKVRRRPIGRLSKVLHGKGLRIGFAPVLGEVLIAMDVCIGV